MKIRVLQDIGRFLQKNLIQVPFTPPSGCLPQSINVVGTRGGLRCGHHLGLLRMAAKLSHVGADVDGLACCLHQPMNCG
jgi:hypothetical protein